MKRLFHDYRSRCLWALTVFCVGASLLPAVWGWAEESPGLSLSIYADQNQYLLGDPIEIKLIAVIKRNIENEPIYTERGFSKVELHRALRITDPGGITHTLEEGPGAHIMPPPFSWKEKDWALAESLAGDFVLSETVHDLKTLLPKMKTTAGWYTIEVRQPFIRFAHTATHSKLGLLGVLDDLENWHGTINSNKIQVFISPGLGAHLQVQVLDTSSQPMEPLAQVPVRVFNKADIPAAYELKDAWSKIKPVLIGITDFKGWATWKDGASCQPKPQIAYTAIGYHQNEYKAALFVEQDSWESGCVAVLERTIFFEEPPASNKFSVYALNSVWIQSKAIVSSGNIGVKGDNSQAWLEGWEVLISENAQAIKDVQILGKSVRILEGASVWDVFYQDELDNKGTIGGQAEKDENLVVATTLPSFTNITPGEGSLIVEQKKTIELPENSYGDITVKSKATLSLKGGTYHVKSLKLDPNSKLICLKPTEIRLAGRLFSKPDVHLVPEGTDSTSPLSAKDIFIYVNGQNGDDGALDSEPKAAEIGTKNNIKANIYVPNGTLWIKNSSVVEGSFIAKDVIIGEKVNVRLDSAF